MDGGAVKAGQQFKKERYGDAVLSFRKALL
jgi:hypothetical protein